MVEGLEHIEAAVAVLRPLYIRPTIELELEGCHVELLDERCDVAIRIVGWPLVGSAGEW